MTHIHWVTRQNKLEIPNDEEDVNTREIHKCDGKAHDPDTMVSPLTPKPTRKAEKCCEEDDVYVVVYYESIKRKLKTKYIWGVGVMKDYNLTLRNLRASHTLSW
jgi:hypothetical protein